MASFYTLWISLLYSEVSARVAGVIQILEVKYFNPPLIRSGLTNIGPNSDHLDVNILLIRTGVRLFPAAVLATCFHAEHYLYPFHQPRPDP